MIARAACQVARGCRDLIAPTAETCDALRGNSARSVSFVAERQPLAVTRSPLPPHRSGNWVFIAHSGKPDTLVAA